MVIDEYRGEDSPRAAFAKYRQDGYALFPKLFSDAEVDELQMRAMLNRGDDRFAQEERGARGTVVHWSAALDPQLDAVRSAPRLRDIVATLLDTGDIRQHGQQLCYRDPGNAEAIVWHRDELSLSARIAEPRRTGLALAIFLDNVLDIDQGAVLFVPGSHGGDTAGLPDPATIARCEAMLPRRGMVGLWNPGTLHGFRPNGTNRDRRSLMHAYVRADATDDSEHVWAWKDGEGLSYVEAKALS
jgi:ectoine hydroxylase-related dioxygenase (phytanoyl-CoA dioxygenase family)